MALQLVFSPSVMALGFSAQNVTTTFQAAWGQIIFADSTAGGFTITLPSAATFNGLPITIIKQSSDANVVTVAAFAGDTINGAATQALTTQFSSFMLAGNLGNSVDIMARSLSSFILSATGNITATAGFFIFANTAAGGFTVTLPLAAANAGQQITIKKISQDGNTVTIARSGSDLIDGQTLQSFSLSYTSVTVVSDGNNWYVI